MPLDQKQSRHIFAKLERQLSKLPGQAAPENVHRFRTYSRRVEALLHELTPKPSGNTKKLLKALAELRKKAGRIRDLDVQTSALGGLKLPQAAGQKAQLLRTLAEERGKRQKKLAKALDEKAVTEVRKRLRRAQRDIEVPEGFDPLARALRQLRQLEKEPVPLDERLLHQYRITGKRARYLAELAGKDPAAERLIEQLKRMQDLIGDWHDWLKLTQRAEELFGGVRDSSLVAALHNVTQAKFRQSVAALGEMRGALAGKPAAPEIAARRPVRHEEKLPAA